MLRYRLVLPAACGLLSFVSPALAHVSVAGPGFANQSQVLTFSVGHGCSGADTVRVEVNIPEEVTTVRALPAVDFGEAEVVTNDAKLVTSVVWSKPTPRAADDHFYQMAIRIKVPDAPFTKLSFPAKQTCRTPDGTETVVNWADTMPSTTAGEESHPVPSITILPVRQTGWNKFTVPNKVDDLSIFADAQIVWADDAAYSSNATTADLIKSEDGVKELTTIEAGAEIWVKY
jgi:uncharacterized protein YcnI